MNSFFPNLARLRGLSCCRSSPLASFSSWTAWSSGAAGRPALLSPTGGAELLQPLPWRLQQIRTTKRGTEYQPKNIKRKRTHGWIKRMSTRGGIEVLLRRMLKGRKSLSH